MLDLVVRSSLLLAIGALAVMLSRRGASAQRHYIWTLTMAGLVALPILTRFVPRLQVLPSGCVVSSAWCAGQAESATRARNDVAPISVSATSAAGPAATTPHYAPRTTHSAISLPSFTTLLRDWWLIGLALVAWRLLTSSVALIRLLRSAKPMTDDAFWIDLDDAATQLGVREPVRLLESPRAAIPMTFGLRRAVIILPSDARSWSDEQRRVVLLHELAHIRRGDARANLLGQVVCALYWFHPLVWGVARRQRIEAERACDDLVLGAGAAPSAYAAQLLAMVQAIATQRAPALALPLAQRSAFEGRVLAILEPGMKRQPLSSRAALLGAGALLSIAVPLAALAPAAQHPRFHGEIAVANSPAPTPTPTPSPDPSGAMPMPMPMPEPMPMAQGGGIHVNPHVKVHIPPVHIRTGNTQEQAAGPEAVAALIEALKDSDEQLREAAVHSLGNIGDTAAVNALIEALRHDSSKDVRKSAAWALGQIEDQRSVAGLLASLREEREVEVRRQVAWALGQIESHDAVAGLGAALRSETDPETKRMEVWALGQIEDHASVPYLTPLLRDADVEVRSKVAWALGQIESHDAVEPIMAALAAEREPEVRSQLIWALGQIEDKRATPALTEAVRDSSVDVRRKAVWALAQLEDDAAAPAFLTAMHDSDVDVRREAIRGLGEIRGEQAMQALLAAMHDADPEIRRAAARALGNR